MRETVVVVLRVERHLNGQVVNVAQDWIVDVVRDEALSTDQVQFEFGIEHVFACGGEEVEPRVRQLHHRVALELLGHAEVLELRDQLRCASLLPCGHELHILLLAGEELRE